MFRNEVGNEDWEVTCVETGLHTGDRAAGSGASASYVDTPTFMLTYGDGIGSVDLAALLAAPPRAGSHRHGDRRAPDVALRRDAGRRAGGRRVQREAERAATDSSAAGSSCSSDAFFDYLSEDEGLFLEQEPLRRLAQDGNSRSSGTRGSGAGWTRIREYTLLNDLWNRGEAPWKSWRD